MYSRARARGLGALYRDPVTGEVYEGTSPVTSVSQVFDPCTPVSEGLTVDTLQYRGGAWYTNRSGSGAVLPSYSEPVTSPLTLEYIRRTFCAPGEAPDTTPRVTVTLTDGTTIEDPRIDPRGGGLELEPEWIDPDTLAPYVPPVGTGGGGGGAVDDPPFYPSSAPAAPGGGGGAGPVPVTQAGLPGWAKVVGGGLLLFGLFGGRSRRRRR